MRYPENGNICTTKAGMSAGTTTTLTTANTSLFSIGGKAYSKAAASNAATPTTDARTLAAFTAIPVNKGGVFVIGYDSGGNLKVCQGETVNLDAGNNLVEAPEFPNVPDTLTPIGYLVVKVGSTGAAWTFGVSNLTGPPTGVTLSFADCMLLPERPQLS
jgi:hypothetical protein